MTISKSVDTLTELINKETPADSFDLLLNPTIALTKVRLNQTS